MRNNTRYDQVVRGKPMPPVYQDDPLEPAANLDFLIARGGALLPARPVPARTRIYPSDKPVYPAYDRSWALHTTDNSFIGNSPHWGAPWLHAQNITALPLPLFPSESPQFCGR